MLVGKALKAARALAKSKKDAKVIRKQKQAKRKLNRSNNKPISYTTRYEKPQGPRRFSKSKRDKQARRDSAAANKINEDWDNAESRAHSYAGTDTERETLDAWQRVEESGKLFSSNLHKRSGHHPAFQAEYLRWQKLYGG